MVRINAHDLPKDQRTIVDALLLSGDAAARHGLIREHGKALIERLETGGHLIEALNGELFPSPLTVRELNAYRPWKAGEENRLRELWKQDVSIKDVAQTLNRSGGDVLQHAWSMDLARKNRFDDDFMDYVPAWRIRRLRLALADAERRGLNRCDDGEGLRHRALSRRFNMGRAAIDGPLKHFTKWTKGDLKTLCQMRDDGRTLATIARVLGRTISSISTKICEMGLSIDKHWSLIEDEVLVEGVRQKLSNKAIAAKLPGRTWRAVKIRALNLGLGGQRTQFRPWTDKERSALREAVSRGENIKEFAVWIGRGHSGVRYQSQIMGLVHPDNTMIIQYTQSEDDAIRAGWAAGEKPEVIAQQIGRTVRGVYSRAFKLGITGSNANFRRRFTAQEIEMVKALVADDKTLTQIASAINRTYMATQKLVKRLSLEVKSSVGYTDADIAVLRNMAANHACQRDVAKALGRTKQSVAAKASQLKIRFSRGRSALAAMAAE